MSEKTLKFKNIRFNKKIFHKSKESIDLFSVNIDEIVYLTNLNIITIQFQFTYLFRKHNISLQI